MYRLLVVAVALLLPAVASAQEWAKPRLENSPRHLEYVTIKHGDREIKAFVAYPEVKEKATAVVVIHEIFGLSEWVRGVTDQLAEAGYIAIAPDLLSGMGENGGGTETFEGGDAVRKAVVGLPPDQVTKDLNATVDYVGKLPAANGKVAVAGFCWGGAQTFRFATNNSEIKAGFVFYGTGPEEKDAIARIAVPIYGFYGENDARVNATIDTSKKLMQEAGKTYKLEIYKEAGHGFMRAGEMPDAMPANKQAREEGWKRWKDLLQAL